MASQKTIDIVKSTAPVLEQHGETITTVFYKRLFKNHPELKDVFNMTHQQQGTQPKVLANAVFKYACHIDKLALLGDTVESIAQKHSSLSIAPAHYPIVGENLLAAIKEVLGDAATPEIMNAWEEAYGDLAAIFVSREEELYKEKENSTGGFRGKKEFIVFKKIQESEVITSFYLKRKDNSPLPKFKPGQYITVTIDIPNTEHKHTRNYSLSTVHNNDYLRISIKKEAGNPNGIVSNYLHKTLNEGDTILAGMPSGDFVLKENDKPVVLLAGGVGITPILSMYTHLTQNTEKEISIIQCAIDSKSQAFQSEIQEKANSRTTTTVLSAPSLSDQIGKTHDFNGFLTKEILINLGISKDSEFYFCGPTPFMANVITILKSLGVSKENINYEFFGPAEELPVI